MTMRTGLALLMALWAIPAGAKGRQVDLDATLDTPVVLEGTARRAYLRVALKGFELEAGRRSPVNLAIVIDRSGSMAGDKLEEAKRGAIMAIQRLRPDDIVSVVAYDDTVQVLAPASKLLDSSDVEAAIARLEPGGSTALFAGVSKGAYELRKYLSDERVNRVILLSDGIANVGPSSPGELAELGSALVRDGIAVTTIGLGLDYNEELMARLATSSDGNHFFAEKATDLARMYDTELGEVTSVIAQDVDVTIHFSGTVRPVRVLGREADVRGQTVVGRLNQLYARQNKFFLIEVELPPGKKGTDLAVADVALSYANMESGVKDRVERSVSCRYGATQAEVEVAQDLRVAGAVARIVGAERNREAMELRDQGKVEEARAVLVENAAYLRKVGAATKNSYVAKDAEKNEVDAENLDENKWKKQRKQMQADQNERVQALGYVAE